MEHEPFVAIAERPRSTIGPRVWLGAGVATVGLGILGLNGLSIGLGEAVTLSSALIYALHIVGLSAWSQAREVHRGT